MVAPAAAIARTMVIPVPRRPVRVRIAPSPTGDPHVGTAYIALFNAAFARHHAGVFVLRIEDTDRKRSTAASEAAILQGLGWLGVAWQEGPDVGGPYGPYRQSERADIYREHVDLLVARRHAYPCFCSVERLDQVRTAQRAVGANTRYDGHCRDLEPAAAAARIADGEPHVVRLRMPLDGETLVPDALRGLVRFDHSQIDDQVLLKGDGLPTYHLANVVDDHLMEITHVIRAEEWINSTPKHLRLYEAFGWAPPVFVHMPLLRNADRSKISKRKNPTSLAYYQTAGFLPEAFLCFLAQLGYSMPDGRELFDFDELAADLDLSRVSVSGPVFDLDKLASINGKMIRAMPPEQLADRVFAWQREDKRHGAVAQLVQERMPALASWMQTAGPFYDGLLDYGLNARYFLIGCASRKKKAVRLGLRASRAFLLDVIERLEALSDWQHDPIEAALREAVATAGVQVGDGFMAVRVAIAGSPAAPPLFESIEVLGRATTLVRVRAAAAMLSSPRFLDETLAAVERELQASRDALKHTEPGNQGA